jgi:SEC-C motif-containing protein
MNSCACGRSLNYELCCGKVHKNHLKAISAEDLMRSRYVAFTKAMGDYLMLSHHLTTRPISEKNEIVNWAKSVEWNRLEVIQVKDGQASDNAGMVEFKAYFYTKTLAGKKLDFIHEKSSFIKENGRWFYLSALD